MDVIMRPTRRISSTMIVGAIPGRVMCSLCYSDQRDAPSMWAAS